MAEAIDNVQNVNESVQSMTGFQAPQPGSVGVNDQLGGAPSTVSKIAHSDDASGKPSGIGAGKFAEVDIDEELFQFKSDDTPLMDLMLKAKKVPVKSAIVEHYMIDEPRSYVTVQTGVSTAAASGAKARSLVLDNNDKDLVRPYQTLLVQGVDGYEGTNPTPGKPLMLYVTGIDANGDPIVRPVNGYKAANAEYGNIPPIPAGTVCTVLANAMYETQKLVEPDTFSPKPMNVILQKRGMTHIVSDYFDSQKKRIPFKDAVIAEQAIRTFKVRGNRTLWGGRAGHFKVNADNGMGMQDVYFTEGLRWQFRRIFSHQSKSWTYKDFIALAKLFFTGEDIPTRAIMLAGKNVLEQIQCIDFSAHPEVTILAKHDPKLGWDVTSIHTVFGDIDIKREPTFERLGWSNCAAIISPDRLVHYQRTTEHTFNEKVEGQEAKRNGIIVWDALALKGVCHLWIEGDVDTADATSDGVVNIKIWDKKTNGVPTAPATTDFSASGSIYHDGDVFYFMDSVTLASGLIAQPGDMYQAEYTAASGNDAATLTWKKYTGAVMAY